MAELASQLCSLLGLPLPQFAETIPYSQPRNEFADITKLSALGVAPQVALNDGLRGFAAWWSGLKAA